MSELNKYSIEFNKRPGFMMKYSDEIGTILFVFEVAEEPSHLVLNKNAIINDEVIKSADFKLGARVAMAFSRVKDFLISRGYKVSDHA